MLPYLIRLVSFCFHDAIFHLSTVSLCAELLKRIAWASLFMALLTLAMRLRIPGLAVTTVDKECDLVHSRLTDEQLVCGKGNAEAVADFRSDICRPEESSTNSQAFIVSSKPVGDCLRSALISSRLCHL